VSRADDFTQSAFAEILETPAAQAERVIFCTGKVYYDLLAHREAGKLEEKVALVRVEQMYPLHTERLHALLGNYGRVKKFVWCQEESQNMGAWSYIAPLLSGILGPDKPLLYAGRNASASPAVGAKKLHDIEQRELVEQAFTL
jgi:2-oxoglutarate dehydrogenase E1 component